MRNVSQVVPPQQLQGSLVNQIPVNRPSVKESFIQNRVINSQIIQPLQPIPIQQQAAQITFAPRIIPQFTTQPPQPQVFRPLMNMNIVPSQSQVILQNQQPIPVQAR